VLPLLTNAKFTSSLDTFIILITMSDPLGNVLNYRYVCHHPLGTNPLSSPALLVP